MMDKKQIPDISFGGKKDADFQPDSLAETNDFDDVDFEEFDDFDSDSDSADEAKNPEPENTDAQKKISEHRATLDKVFSEIESEEESGESENSDVKKAPAEPL
jgi:hypothetical protein